MAEEVTKKTFHHALWEDGESRFHFGGEGCGLDRRPLVEAFDHWYTDNWYVLNSALRCHDPQEALRRITNDVQDVCAKEFLLRNGNTVLEMLK